MRHAALAAVLASTLATAAPIQVEPLVQLREQTFNLPEAAEVTASIRASCPGCSWGTRGREAAAVVIRVDDRYSQHLYLARGADAELYHVGLGAIGAGEHSVRVLYDPAASAAGVKQPVVHEVVVMPVQEAHRLAMSMTPFIYARPDTIGRFSDIPLVMWYEIVPKGKGREIRYSVIFSNEDGGTATDRLMATWGRPTDIEFIYGVELDAAGRVVEETYQGNDHEILKFAGTKEGRHPLLWVVSHNNMVSDRGTTKERYAPMAELIDLADVSRELVMDRLPWTYRISAQEIEREGRIADAAVPGSKQIPDLRRFAYVEACGELTDATLSFAVAVERAVGRLEWYESDGGLPDFRIARSGCFRGAVALPSGTALGQLKAVRFKAFTRPPKKDEPPLPPGAGAARLTRVNTVFMLMDNYAPGRRAFRWAGTLPLTPDGEAKSLPF